MPVLDIMMVLVALVLLGSYITLFILNTSMTKGATEVAARKADIVAKIAGITLIVNFCITPFAYDRYFSEELIIIAVSLVLVGIGFLIKTGVGRILTGSAAGFSAMFIVIISIENLEGGAIVSIFFGLFWLMAILGNFIKTRVTPWIGFVIFLLYALGCIALIVEGPEWLWLYVVLAVPGLLAMECGWLRLTQDALARGVSEYKVNEGELCVSFKTQASAVLQKTLPMEIFLYCITCGVWELVWVYQVSKYLNEATGIEERNPAGCVWLSFLPFYRAYWAYRQALRIETLIEERGKKTEHLSIVAFVAALLCPMLSFVMLQNKIAELLQSEEE